MAKRSRVEKQGFTKSGLRSVKYLCSELKTNGGVPDGEDPVSWLRGKFIQMDDHVPDFSSKAVKDEAAAA